ncbi:major capsid family protein [Klebsiella pneumoniae]|uniref:major capsid family protein n=1 Tax=Klebsiella pneumoniae TaxID=573 RepID=UPI002E2AB2FB|nr:major capsid family protein [Klebsiella pneumoniae]MED6058028.1 major capsid family protein [Klebsiella pneumoniae]
MTMKLDAFEQNAIKVAMQGMGIDANKLDAHGIWTVNQLTQLLNRQYEQAYPQTGVLELFPVTTELSPVTKNFEWLEFDGVTSAKIIADYTDDLPTVEAMASEKTGKVFRLGNAWFISIDEIKAGQALGSSLSDRKASLAREGHETLVNDLVFKGSAPHNIVSVFDQPNINRLTSASWTTPEIAFSELQDLIDTIEDVTMGRHHVTNIVIPPSKRRLLTQKMPDVTESYLAWFKENYPNVTITAIAELEDIDGAGTKGVLAYEKDPMNMSIEIPERFNMLPMQPKDLHFKVPCTSKCTGLIVYRPLTIAILSGV